MSEHEFSDLNAYDDLDDLFEDLARQAGEAEAFWETVPPWYRTRLVPGFLGAHEARGIVIFVELLPDDPEEVQEDPTPWNALVRGYSVACVEGEMGYAYSASLVPVNRETFEEARTAGWAIPWERVAQEGLDQIREWGNLADPGLN